MIRGIRRLALPAAALLCAAAAPQSTGSFALVDASSEQVAQAYWSRKPGPPMAAGQWDRSVTVAALELPDLPAGPDRDARIAGAIKPPKVESVCVDGHELSAPEPKAVFEKLGEDCLYHHIRMGDGKLDARISCKGHDGQGDVVNAVTGTYDAASFAMVMKLEMKNGSDPGRMIVTMKLDGRRTGACKR